MVAMALSTIASTRKASASLPTLAGRRARHWRGAILRSRNARWTCQGLTEWSCDAVTTPRP